MGSFKLESADGFEFIVPKELALKINVISMMNEDNKGADECIPIPCVLGSTLQKMLYFLEDNDISFEAEPLEAFADLLEGASYLDYKELLYLLVSQLPSRLMRIDDNSTFAVDLSIF